MKKILKVVGMISALILSVLGLSACSNGKDNISLYGVPSAEERGTLEHENSFTENQ